MTASELPARPPAVAEWEDLLVRVEIMQRALRFALEDAGAAPEVDGIVRGLLDREARASRWLSAAAGSAGPEPAAADPRDAYERFLSLRRRNFALLQRRGLEVWDWTGDLDGEGRVTAYQLLTHLVLRDAATLASLREAARSGTAAC